MLLRTQEKGHNEVPIDTLKEAWEKHELAEHVKLTISTCLGPCRMHNVSLLKTANERTWIGKLSTQEDYLALVEWALDVAKLGEDAKLPRRTDSSYFQAVSVRHSIKYTSHLECVCFVSKRHCQYIRGLQAINMNKWIYLALAIGSEVVATSSLKSTEGFTKLWPSLLVLAGTAQRLLPFLDP